MNKLLAILIHVALAQLRVISPPELKGLFDNGQKLSAPGGVIPGSTATFGAPRYGDIIVGKLHIIEQTACGQDPPLSVHASADQKLRNVVMIKRGGCPIAEKVLNAQNSGHANAVIIADDTWDRLEVSRAVIISDDDAAAEIKIPSILISAQDASELMKASKTSEVVVALDWTFPQRDAVKIEYWYSPADMGSLSYMASLANLTRSFENRITLHPHVHMTFRSPPDAGCFSANSELCLTNGTSESVLAAIDQLCLRKMVDPQVVIEDDDDIEEIHDESVKSQTGLPYDTLWKYFDLVLERCPLSVTVECSKKALETLNINMNTISECVQSNATELLQLERENKAWRPGSVRLNGIWYSGVPVDPEVLIHVACKALNTDQEWCLKKVEELQLHDLTATESLSETTESVAVRGSSFVPFFRTCGYLMIIGGIGVVAFRIWQQNKHRKDHRRDLRQLELYFFVDDHK